MTIQQIINKYLPMLQALQRTVAKTWKDRNFLMLVNTGHKYIKAEIFQLDELSRPIDSVSCYIYAGEDVDSINEKVMNLHSWFGANCITTVTGVDSVICPN